MRIAQLAPLYEDVPPTAYGGTERVIANLCDGLTAAGHDVTLFATGTSRTRASLEPMVNAPLRDGMTAAEMADVGPHLHLRMLADVFERAADFDVIHSHVDLWTLPFAGSVATPTVLTLHGRLDMPSAQRLLPMYPEISLVSISDHQRLALGGLGVRWAATVPNGLDLDDYHRQPRQAGTHLAFVGRICPEKRPDHAVEIARRTGRNLQVAAKVDPTDEEYFAESIKPLFDRNDVEYLGEVGERHKPEFYAAAAATLFPSDWPEPFGLVMIESLAAGTPVIALRRGAVPEVIEHGVSGFICDDVDEMVATVGRIDEIDPAACRQRARAFGADQMCARYESVYMAVLDRLRDDGARSAPDLVSDVRLRDSVTSMLSP
jgi:glycosyltransferase involved in cell wall biosynthesis